MIRDSILILIDSGVVWGTSLPAGFRGHTMAPAHVARASTNTDSIKGLAQSLANPAYHRLLVAEPALRRAFEANAAGRPAVLDFAVARVRAPQSVKFFGIADAKF